MAKIKITASTTEKGLNEASELILEEIIFRAERFAKIRAPVKTGYHRNHIKAEKTKKGAGTLKAEAPYASHLEWGTIKMDAQPSIEPGIIDAINSFR